MELGTRFKIIGLLLTVVLLFSCKKEEDRTCFKSLGEESSYEINSLDVRKLRLDSKIKYVFIQDSLNKAVVYGGKNLLKHIAFDYNEDSVLHIKNENKCNFLRKMNRQLTVEIHFTNLELLYIKSGDSVVSRGIIKGQSVKTIVEDGAASIAMGWDVDELDVFVKYGFTDITYYGKTRIFNSNITLGTALNALNLNVSQSVYISSNSSESAYINVGVAALTGETRSNGNVYYKGTPNYMLFEEKFGTGRLIKLD